MSHIEAYDRWRTELGAFFRTSPYYQGFWVFDEMDNIRDAYQHPEIFSSTATTPDTPDPPYQWIPQMLDPPQHTKWRQLLAPWFTPGAVAKLDTRVRERAAGLIEPLVERGGCDFLADFAQRFPTSIFMEVMGLPSEDVDQFLIWEHAILQRRRPRPRRRHQGHVRGHGLLRPPDQAAARRPSRRPGDRGHDMDDRRPGDPHDDLLSMYLLMFMAGLDTVTIQLSYMWWHLAGHDEDRRRVVDDPALIPSAVEESLRAYSFVPPARKVMKDVDFHGCPMKAGDMVLLPLCAANRDPAAFDRPTGVLLDRPNNNHLGFKTGPHRCLGSHLARRELRIAMEEWHARIPDYRLPAGLEVREHGGMFGIDNLTLTWEP